MTVSVRDVLALPVMREARVVAGGEGRDSREVRWVAVSEGPVEDFVREGELILTSAMGCDNDGVATLVREVMDAGAAALCIGVGPGRFVERIPDGASAIAKGGAFPLIELPWEVRFADITRAVVDQVLADRYGADDRSSHRPRFTNVVLDGLGFRGIADRLESLMTRAVVIFDSDVRPQAFGRRARTVLGADGIAAVQRASSALSLKDVEALGSRFSLDSARPLADLSPLALGAGLGLAVPARRRPAAYVFAFSDDHDATEECDFDALLITEAAEAVALEASRRQAAAEAESRVRGHFLWGIATGTLDTRGDISEDAALLGYSCRASYEVAVVETSQDADVCALERQIESSARLVGVQAHCGRRAGRLLVMVEAADGARDSLRRILQAAQDAGGAFAAGVARGTWRLAQLRQACEEAEQTISVANTMLGPNAIAHAAALKPFLLVGRIARDPQGRATAIEVLRPLLEYDERRNGALVETLEAFLDERCNASRTARRLFLNRHSLLHRLERIEELTKCSLEDRDDRFVLEISLRLLRFGELEDRERA